MALALVPAPPETAALTNSMLGFFFLKSATIASSPSCSPAPVHHENTSTWSLGSCLGGSLGGSLTASLGGSFGGSLAGSFAFEHAAMLSSAAARLRVT